MGLRDDLCQCIIVTIETPGITSSGVSSSSDPKGIAGVGRSGGGGGHSSISSKRPRTDPSSIDDDDIVDDDDEDDDDR